MFIISGSVLWSFFITFTSFLYNVTLWLINRLKDMSCYVLSCWCRLFYFFFYFSVILSFVCFSFSFLLFTFLWLIYFFYSPVLVFLLFCFFFHIFFSHPIKFCLKNKHCGSKHLILMFFSSGKGYSSGTKCSSVTKFSLEFKYRKCYM